MVFKKKERKKKVKSAINLFLFSFIEVLAGGSNLIDQLYILFTSFACHLFTICTFGGAIFSFSFVLLVVKTGLFLNN